MSSKNEQQTTTPLTHPGFSSDLLGATSDFDFNGGDCFFRAGVREAAGSWGHFAVGAGAAGRLGGARELGPDKGCCSLTDMK